METIANIINNPLFSILTGLLGFYFGQKFSLWRDQRKEFNEVADEMFNLLANEKNKISPTYSVKKVQFANFARRLNFIKRKKFYVCVENYYKVREGNYKKDTMGGFYFQDTAPIISAIDQLLRFTKRK